MQVPPGHAFIAIIPEESRYFYPPSTREPWTFSWLNYYGDLSIQIWKELRRAFGGVIPIPFGSPAACALERLIERIEEKNFRDRFEESREAFSFFTLLWQQLAMPGKSGRGNLPSMVQLAQDRYRDAVSVKELAGQTGLSREHFSRLFKSRHGIAPATFLRQQRIQAALKLLQSTTLSIREIALRCGFYSARHFSSAFHRENGKSPQSARKKPGRKKRTNALDPP